MPYFITNESPDCSGWAVVKSDGEVLGCHTIKKSAIDQMVAISLAEGVEVGGERNDSGPQAVIVDIDGILIMSGNRVEKTYNFLETMEDTEIIIVTGRSQSTREETISELESLDIDFDRIFLNPFSSEQTPEFKKDTAEKLLETYNIILAIDDGERNRAAYRELGITALDLEDIPSTPTQEFDESDESDEEDMRAINQSAPAFMRAAARRGLAYYADGKGGDGLVDKTIREARLMADGQVSDDKWIRIAAWIARHMPDLDSPNANPSSDNYPSAGVVAHLLWGSGPSKSQATRAMNYAQRVVERIRAEEDTQRWSNISVNLIKGERQDMTKTVERRINNVEFDVRDIDENKTGMSFTGYAAVFDSPSEPLPFTEVIRAGAFQRSLKSRNEVKLFMNHNTDVVLGSTRAGTLKLIEDGRGLLAQAELPDTTAGRDLSVLMKRGDVNSMSFGFSVPANGDKWSSDGSTRELHQIRLHEVSIVTGFPAYEATTASVRSLDILATRTNVDVDALSDAILKLEAGETLDADHASLITEVVEKLRIKEEPNLHLLEIKRKQLELMAKVF
jgi:HK97 family phage prohead protease